MLKTKICSRCHDPKERGAFGPCKRKRDGLRSECNACRRGDYAANPEPAKASRRDAMLGKGATTYFIGQLIEQDGACAICGNRKMRMGLDHNHTTGQWRGALCARCNSGLGDFMENPNFLNNAIAY